MQKVLTAEELAARLRTLLPEQYAETYETLQPTPMRSAGLKFVGGKVAWDEIWGSFCDLAMAGGPPHRGTLLRPASAEEIAASPERYGEVTAEICRGLHLVTGLFAEPAPVAGWVRIYCTSAVMAGWLARAIVLENVAAHASGLVLSVPAGPAFRLEKEIKNVVVAAAKTTHYWTGHRTAEQQDAIAALFREMASEGPVLQPALVPVAVDPLVLEGLQRVIPALYEGAPGWVGLECGSAEAATRATRLLLATNAMSRREGTSVFVPFENSESDVTLAALCRVSRVEE